MPDVLAIVSRPRFDEVAGDAKIGDRLAMDRYTSTSKHLDKLASGGRLFLVTVRPYEKLWLVAILERPEFHTNEWIAPAPSTTPITDISDIKQMLVFESGKGISLTSSLGQSLQTPRALTEHDAKLLDAAVAGTVKAAAPMSAAPLPVRRDDERTGYRIERARSGRSTCATCELAIGKDQLRVAEPHRIEELHRPVDRFHHLDCAVTAHPPIVRLALIGTTDDVMPESVRDAIEAKIDASLERARVGRLERFTQHATADEATAPPSTDDALTASMLAQLDDDPEDVGVLGVLADVLQAAGDPRGELITVQLALAAIPVDERRRTLESTDDDDDDEDDGDHVAVAPTLEDRGTLTRRRDELFAELAPAIGAVMGLSNTGERCIWGTGYVRRLELVVASFAWYTRLDVVERGWRHPSLRFLVELGLDLSPEQAADAVSRLAAMVPATLRRVDLDAGGTYRSDNHLGEIGVLAAALPRLEHLTLSGRIDGSLAHPRLARLDLTGHHAAIVAQLDTDALPALSRLVLRRTTSNTDLTCKELADHHWLRRLTHLDLIDGQLGEAGVAALAKGLGKRKLARLDVTGNAVPMRLRSKLAGLCEELVCPMPRAGSDDEEAVKYADHANRPEWGTGKVLRIFDGKIEIEFDGPIGKKVFKLDAAFLRLS